MKIVCWINDEPNQKALISKLEKQFQISGIVCENRPAKTIRDLSTKELIIKAISRVFFQKIDKVWSELQRYYVNNYHFENDIPTIYVKNINEQNVYDFTQSLNADLVIVSGTSLVKKKNLEIPLKIGILNLHTGLSPYIKGGPNCTNWCISTNQFEFIGNTIMWIDEGIDSGNIFFTERTKLNGNESFFDIHFKVMEHAHELYIKAINNLNCGQKNSISQNKIDKGKTYFSKDWGIRERINLIKNLNKRNTKISLQDPIEINKIES